jgi:hypothetical protein
MVYVFSRINEARGLGMPELKQMQQRQVARDGNCLFRAASVALSGDTNMGERAEAENARQLRLDVVGFMRANRASFAGFMPEGHDFEEYLQTMTRDGVWGGELEVSAIARYKRQPVHVFIRDETKYQLLSMYPADSKDCTDKICLLFHGKHYDALFESL